MPKSDTFVIRGASGTQYSFDAYPIGTKFNPLGAVYAITKRELRLAQPSVYHFVYVGETGDLSERFKAHHKQECFEKLGADFIGVHLDGSQRSRTDKEDDLRSAYRWPCNG